MPPRERPGESWIWYTSRTRRCVPLDTARYPSIPFSGGPIPFPDWVCQRPDGGIHIDDRVGQVDVDVAQRPVSGIEINWTCDYGVKVLARRWFDAIEDLVDQTRVFVGEVRLAGRPLDAWVTLHELGSPPLVSSKGGGKPRCPNCGHRWMALHGSIYFVDPDLVGQPLIVNSYGVFVREDIALSRNLRRPTGAFKPTRVRMKWASAREMRRRQKPPPP